MDQIWIEMYNVAKTVLGTRTILEYATAGEVNKDNKKFEV